MPEHFDPDPAKIYRVYFDEVGDDGRVHVKEVRGTISFTDGGGVLVKREGDTDVYLPRFLRIQTYDPKFDKGGRNGG